MNREEFDIWQKGIYEIINESSINDLSQLKGDVGTHNNRTPEQIKANNEKKASLRARAVEKMKSVASKAGEAIKNGVKSVAHKTSEVVKAKNAFAGKDNKPMGLTSFDNKSNTDSNSAHSSVSTHNSNSNVSTHNSNSNVSTHNSNSNVSTHNSNSNDTGLNKGNASSTASKFAKGVQKARQLRFLTNSGKIIKKYIQKDSADSKADDNKKVKATDNAQPKASKKPSSPQLKTDDNKTVVDTVLKHHAKSRGSENKSLGQKLKDTAKKAIYGANDLTYKVGDAKKFVKDAWDRRDAHNKRVRGIKDEPKAEEKSNKAKENLNKKNNNPQQSSNNPQQSSNTRTTASNSNRGSYNGGSTVNVHVTNHSDEHAKKNAQAKADAEKDREEFFGRVNSKAKGETTKGEKGEEPKAETNTPAKEKKEPKAKKLSKNTPKTIEKESGGRQLSFLTKSGNIKKKYIQNGNKGSEQGANTNTNNQTPAEENKEPKAKKLSKTTPKIIGKKGGDKPEAKQLSFLTKSGDIKKKYIQNGNKGSEQGANTNTNNQTPAEENKENKNGKPNATDSNKPAVETGDKNTNQGKGKGETNSKNTNKGKGNKGGSKPATETSTPAEENKDNNQSTAETGDKNANQGKGKGANQGKGKGETNKGKGETNSENTNKGTGETNNKKNSKKVGTGEANNQTPTEETNNKKTNKNIPDKIINIPIDQQAHGRDLSNEKPTDELKPGAAAGSNSLQHLKTTGEEPSMYDDEKGNPVPTTPAAKRALDKANGKDVVGTRTPKKTFIVKNGTGETKKVTNDNNSDGGNNPDDNKPTNKTKKVTNKTKKVTNSNSSDGDNNPNGDNKPNGDKKSTNQNKKVTNSDNNNPDGGNNKPDGDNNKPDGDKKSTNDKKLTNQNEASIATSSGEPNPPDDNGDNDENNNAEKKDKKKLTDEEKAKKRLEIKAKLGKKSLEEYNKRKAELAKLKAGNEDTRTSEQRAKDNEEIINNPNNPNHAKDRYQLSSLDGSKDPETGKQDGKPVDKEKFYKTLEDQNKKIDSETEAEKAKRNSGSTRASNNAAGKKGDAEKNKKKEQEEKNRISSFIDSVLNSDDDEEPSEAELKKIDKSINKYLGKNKK